MVVRYKYIGITAVILILGAMVFWWFYEGETEDDKIRRLLTEVVENVNRRHDEGTSGNLLRSNRLPKYFTDPCDVSIGVSEVGGVYSEAQITNNSMRARAMFKTISAQISDIHIIHRPDSERAIAEFSATLDGVFNNDETVHGVRDLRCELEKQDGQWKISTINIRQVLEK